MTLTKITQIEVPKVGGALEVWPLSIRQYQRMIAAGILSEGAPVELIEGYLVGKDRGLGQAMPQPCVVSAGQPRLGGTMSLWPLSLQQYQRMIAEGILDEDAPIEFFEGHLVAWDRGGGPGMPPAPEHSSSTGRVNRRLSRALPEEWVVRVQDPIDLGTAAVPGAGSQPQPDVAVVQGPESLYDHRFPGPADVRLLVEVAESSLLDDRRYKGPVYATAAIPLYWIVNLRDRQLEVFSDPDAQAGQYRTLQILTENENIVLAWAGLAPLTFAVRDFLP